MLKKYEENAYLMCRIFGNEIIDSESDSSDSDNKTEEQMQTEVNLAALEGSIPKSVYEELKELSKEREELEQEYTKVDNDQQKLEEFQDDELDTFENSNKDFHLLFHELKQAKLKSADIECYIKKAKDLGVFPDTHPIIMALEGRSNHRPQRPFSDKETVEYIKL